jgi:hypothetical protein
MYSAIRSRGSTFGCLLLVTLGCGGQAEGSHDGGSGGARSSLPGVGGTQSTVAAPSGGAHAGGTSSLAGGANGGTGGSGACAKLGDDHCVTECFRELKLVDNAICADGAWACRSGYVLASSCPPRACGVTPDGCCNMTTGIVSENPCNMDGARRACADGATDAYLSQTYCVPLSLGGRDCQSLDRQPCTGPAVSCHDLSAAFVHCVCSGLGTDGSAGTWQCSSYIGP